MTRVVVVCLLVMSAAPPALAQAPAPAGPSLRPHRFTVSGGLAWLGGYGIGSATAALRRNETGTLTPNSFTLFNADAALRGASGAGARVGFALTRSLAVEFGASYSRPTLAVEITGDTEAGESATLEDQRLLQYIFDVSAQWQISQLDLGARARPYVTVGGGYLRQLDVDRVRAETGNVFHVGGGVRYWLRGGDGARRALGVRTEANAQIRSNGLDFEGERRVSPTANVFLFFGF
jgi:hypothetical protein